MDKALLRLFNGVRHNSDKNKEYSISDEILERTISNGYILSPHIPLLDVNLLDTIESIIGLSGEKLNASFHKSWLIIQEASIEQLVIQQLLHYFTTYGFEALGIYSEQTIYIPNEALELPEEIEGIPLIVIRAMSDAEIKGAVIKLSSGIALAAETIVDIMTIMADTSFLVTVSFVEHIKNRELKAALMDKYDIVPTDPVGFLRYVISKLTDETLLIKNDYLIEKIKEGNGKFLDELLKDAPFDLASIFLRYKPLFLAMKTISRNKNFFNRLRKQADKMHKPLPVDYMNSITEQIKNGTLKGATFERKLNKASVFRKIRLAYALQYRMKSPESIVYNVRNGKGWATDFSWDARTHTNIALVMTLDSIAKDLVVKDKVFFIPDNIHYALPATEKQFTGNFPSGTYIVVPDDMIVGVHWTNTDNLVDLDLSLLSTDGKIGWDTSYRTEDRTLLFSGDLTTAPKPNGASEFFYISKAAKKPYALLLNYYNHSKGDEVEAKIIVGHDTPKVLDNKYMIDPNKVIATARINITKKQNTLGLVVNVDGENRVYFSHTSVGNSFSSRNDEVSTHARNYLIAKSLRPIDFNNVLLRAGATIVNNRPDDGEYIDLSPETLTKTTFLDLLLKEL